MSFTKAINEFNENFNETVIQFLRDNGVDELISAWNNNDIQKKNKELIKKYLPKKIKDKNAPKKNQNSYMFFCQDVRDDIKGKNPDIDGKAILVEMEKQWKLLKKNNPEKVKKYEAMAAEDKVRYASDKENYTPHESEVEEDSTPKERKKRDPDAPKGAKNSYILFCQHERKSVKEETGFDVKKFRAELTLRWKKYKENNDDMFDKYQVMAADEKKNVKAANNTYKTSNNQEEEALKEEPVEEKAKKTVTRKMKDDGVEPVEEKPKAKKTVTRKMKDDGVESVEEKPKTKKKTVTRKMKDDGVEEKPKSKEDSCL
jgi:hypothetical protein